MAGRSLDVRQLSERGQLGLVLAIVAIVGGAMVFSTEHSAHPPATATVVRDPVGSPRAEVVNAALRSDVLLVALAERQHAATHGGALMVDKLIISGGTARSQNGWDGLAAAGFDPRVNAMVLSAVFGANDQFCLTASSPETADAVYFSSQSQSPTPTRPPECDPPPG